MKVISAYDLLLAEPLVGMTQFDLAHIDNLDKVNAVLAVMGFDINKAIHVYAAQHRTMKNEVKVGYLFAGELNLAREHIKGKYSRPEDFMIAAQMQDKSLFEELHNMNSRCNDYGANNKAIDKGACFRENDEYAAEEDKITKEIQQLEELLLHIRGDQYNPDGSIKTAEDYKNPQDAGPKRLRRKSVKKQQGE